MSNNDDLLAKLHSETAKIDWADLQRFFAKGEVLYLAPKHDLVSIAVFFAEDNAEKLKKLVDSNELVPVSDQQARVWYESKSQVWSVVVAPFILVQDIKEAE